MWLVNPTEAPENTKLRRDAIKKAAAAEAVEDARQEAEAEAKEGARPEPEYPE